MYNAKLGGDIHQGDLVAIANGNDFTVGIYFGRGKSGTVQYYHPTAPEHCMNAYNDRIKAATPEKQQEIGPFVLGRLWKDYVNAPRDTRVMKLNRDNITDPKMIHDIQKSKEILAQFNITVNF
jgi:hypothetical protein